MSVAFFVSALSDIQIFVQPNDCQGAFSLDMDHAADADSDMTSTMICGFQLSFAGICLQTHICHEIGIQSNENTPRT